MSFGELKLTSAQLLYRRLLWHRALDEPPRRQPVVVLLGPVGAGKSTALSSISDDCGDSVVHARFDFHPDEPADTVQALTDIAFDLSRGWTNRPSARFTRFALGLIAVQLPLDTAFRGQATAQLDDAIKQHFSGRRRQAERVAAWVETLAESAKNANILSPPLAEAIKVALPSLIKTVIREPLGRAQRWHADIPAAEGASPKDALIMLNRRSRNDPTFMTNWLTAAFLADVRESHRRMSDREAGTSCACANPQRRQHIHNWVLLLDNIDHPGGATLLAALLSARRQYELQHDDGHDALLVVATSGRWDPGWGAGWRPPWEAEPAVPDGVRTVAWCHQATHENWAGQTRGDLVPPTYYPVLLEPHRTNETAKMLGIAESDLRTVLAQRATGGLPALVETVKPLLVGRDPEPGVRDVLRPFDRGRPEAGQWQERLARLRLRRHLGDISIEEFVSAAPFATAPWLIPADATSPASAPHVSRILTELRSALWVLAPSRRGDIAGYWLTAPTGGGTALNAELHPWVARTLAAALAARDHTASQPSYQDQFETLLADPATAADPVRKAYCQLALGQVSAVVDYFTEVFDRRPHQAWIGQLRLVALAPDNRSVDQRATELFDTLVSEDVERNPSRSDLGNIVTRLLIRLWLAKNPFVMPDRSIWSGIADDYSDLRSKTRRDVSPLTNAANLAMRGLL
jgi:hypothetical protein